MLETGFAIVLFILVLLFYLSNPRNNVNKWCSIAGFIFWLGVAKEAVMYNIVPVVQNAFGVFDLQARFMRAYSVCTWALYSLAMPTAVIFAFYFCDLDETRPKLLRILKAAVYIPAIVISLFFPPLSFREYQMGCLIFWYTYAAYNLSQGVLFCCLMIRGVRLEKPGKSRAQKRQVRLVVLPPVIFWLASVFLTHPFQISGLFKLWQVNAFILTVGVIIFIIMAFRDGFMGLKLSGETYHWNSSMSLINTGAEYTSHMLKNQTAKMELCIEQMKSHFTDKNEAPPEELAIMSRSILTLKSYVDKIKRHSQSVQLHEEPCGLARLLIDATDASLAGRHGDITAHINVPENVFWICDKSHMTEVFVNIITNAAEAMRGAGEIEIDGLYDKSEKNYLLHIKDTGAGIPDAELKDIFTPYYTTKSTEKNFGLGLAYCENVVTKHGGSISAKSRTGKGTVITITFPSKRVAAGGVETRNRDA